jgi:superfamily I DNA/RNA helicase
VTDLVNKINQKNPKKAQKDMVHDIKIDLTDITQSIIEEFNDLNFKTITNQLKTEENNNNPDRHKSLQKFKNLFQNLNHRSSNQKFINAVELMKNLHPGENWGPVIDFLKKTEPKFSFITSLFKNPKRHI